MDALTLLGLLAANAAPALAAGAVTYALVRLRRWRLLANAYTEALLENLRWEDERALARDRERYFEARCHAKKCATIAREVQQAAGLPDAEPRVDVSSLAWLGKYDSPTFDSRSSVAGILGQAAVRYYVGSSGFSKAPVNTVACPRCDGAGVVIAAELERERAQLNLFNSLILPRS